MLRPIRAISNRGSVGVAGRDNDARRRDSRTSSLGIDGTFDSNEFELTEDERVDLLAADGSNRCRGLDLFSVVDPEAAAGRAGAFHAPLLLTPASCLAE